MWQLPSYLQVSHRSWRRFVKKTGQADLVPVYLQAPHIIVPSLTEGKFSVFTIKDGELPKPSGPAVIERPKIISVPGIGPYNSKLRCWGITPWLPPSPDRRSLSAWRTGSPDMRAAVLEWDPQNAQFKSRFFRDHLWDRTKLIYGILMPSGSWSISRGCDIDSAPHCNHNGQFFPSSSKTNYRGEPQLQHNAVVVQSKLPHKRELESAGFCPVSGNVLSYVTREDGDWTAHPVVLTRTVVCTMFKLSLQEVRGESSPQPVWN